MALIAHRERWTRRRRLFSPKAIIPGCISLFSIFLWFIDRLGEIQFIHDTSPLAVCYMRTFTQRLLHMSAVAIVIPLIGFCWLTGVVLWPELMIWLATDLSRTNLLARTWRPLGEGETDSLARQLMALGKHTIIIVHNDAIDCGDLAEDFVEAFQRGGWSVPRKPGVPHGSSGARGISIRSRPKDNLAFSLAATIAKTTYIVPEVGELAQNEYMTPMTITKEKIEESVTIDAILSIMPMRRRPLRQSS